jgi:hypothetical protein
MKHKTHLARHPIVLILALFAVMSGVTLMPGPAKVVSAGLWQLGLDTYLSTSGKGA